MKALVAAGSLALAAAAYAQPDAADIIVKDDAGRVATGRVEAGLVVYPRSVYTTTLGLLGIPNATFDPGLDSESGAFTPSTQIGLTLRRALRLWDGSGFATIPDERLALTKNATTITTPIADPANCQAAGSLLVGVTSSTGRIHQHPAYELLAPADTGIYLAELEVWMGAPGQGTSRPVFILLNQNEPAATLDAAFAWAEANLPAPVCYANCDNSTSPPVLNVNDFVCFLNAFASGSCAANCDGGTTPPVLNVNDFVCFQNRFAAGCP
ncbi:MAG: GC-type dockerin domain-anchored protein [Phycisphaerales bacterium]